jgi:glycosyltransferase involved in cell wall biosynthesis
MSHSVPPPLVAVVIPCYNQAHFVAEAIESVLRQRYPAFEVVVVNDGSTDATAEVVSRFSAVHCIQQPNRGLAAARNTGLAHCRGEFVVFLDADDRLLPGALERGATLLMADSSLGFVAGYSVFITRNGVQLPTEQPVRAAGDPYVSLLRRNSIRNPAMVMFRRRMVEAVGGFDSRFDACADSDMYLRISRTCPVRFHDAVVAEYRKHGENMSLDAALMLRQMLTVMRQQRPHIVGPSRRDAFRDGQRHVRQYYGDLLATQIRDRVRARAGWRRVLQDLATLIWWHPRGALEHARRKVVCYWRGAETGEAA